MDGVREFLLFLVLAMACAFAGGFVAEALRDRRNRRK